MAHGGNDNGVMYHTGLRESDLEGARYAILPGDPFRVPKIAALADSSRELTWSREYRSELAVISGEPVLVISHGIGGPSTAIAVEELYQIGIRNFIRVGTSGGMQMDVKAGDIVVINAAIRAEGCGRSGYHRCSAGGGQGDRPGPLARRYRTLQRLLFRTAQSRKDACIL